MIKLENMFKIYTMGDNEVRALNDVTLHIKPKQFIAIVGPSGSGKSTLMNMIGCLDAPTSGKYYIDGVEISTLKDDDLADIRNQKIGFIFQGFNLLSKLTAIENVELPLIYRGIGKSERQRLSQIALDRVGLGDRTHHRPNELSGGQQQRVAIARALSTSPPIILADEPTGALDSKSGIEIMKMLHEIHEAGNTIVLITHDNEIAKQAERIVRMHDGEIIFGSEVDSE